MRGIAAIDGAVLLATLVVTAGVGLLAGRRARTTRAFVAGERDLPAWAVLLSIVATETSSVTFLSVPGKSFTGDLRFLQLPLGYLLGRVAVAWLLLPHYFEGESLTAYEVLGRRFGQSVKRLSSLLFLVTRSVADGLRLYLAALPLALLAGLDLWVALAVMAGVTVAYTLVGGMRAVVWTDVVQFFIYVAGGVLALYVAASGVPDGFAGVIEEAEAAGKLRIFDFTPTLASGDALWAGLIGGAFLSLATHGADQLMVQRYLCARSQRQAAVALITSGVVVLVQFALFLCLGLALHAWFQQDGRTPEGIAGDEAFPTFIATRLVEIPGAVGLVLGAIFAVSMSTLSSSLNASAAAAVNDLVRPVIGRRWDDGRTLRVTRAATVLFAGIQMACGLLAPRLGRSVVDQVLAIAGLTTGITLGLFFLAHVLPRAAPESVRFATQARAATAALLLGLAGILALWYWSPLSSLWYSLVGSLGTLLIGMLIAAVLRGRAVER